MSESGLPLQNYCTTNFSRALPKTHKAHFQSTIAPPCFCSSVLHTSRDKRIFRLGPSPLVIFSSFPLRAFSLFPLEFFLLAHCFHSKSFFAYSVPLSCFFLFYTSDKISAYFRGKETLQRKAMCADYFVLRTKKTKPLLPMLAVSGNRFEHSIHLCVGDMR